MASKEESGPKADDDSGSKLSKHDAIAKKPPPAPPPAVKAGEKAEFYIAKGKAITSRRGILAEGDSCQLRREVLGSVGVSLVTRGPPRASRPR